MSSKSLLVILLVLIVDGKKNSKRVEPNQQSGEIEWKNTPRPSNKSTDTTQWKDRKNDRKPFKKNEGIKMAWKDQMTNLKKNLKKIKDKTIKVNGGFARISIEQKNITCSMEENARQNDRRRKHSSPPQSSGEQQRYQCQFLSRSRTRKGTCLLTEDLVCDGVSACSTDECACEGSQVFYCSNGEGCVALEQVCDGQTDCLDASDECVCDSYLNCESDRSNGFCRNDDMRTLRCGFSSVGDIGLKKSIKNNFSGLFQCIKREFTGTGRNTQSFRTFQNHAIWCKSKCRKFSNHCENIDWSSLLIDTETKFVSVNYTCGIGSSIALSADVDVCDGFYDCPNRADEASCANRFYCDDGSKSIPLSKVCDSVPDCEDMTDECQQCARNNLADDKFMISNKYISYYMVVLFFFVIVFNLRGIFGHAAKLYYETNRYSTKVNSILCLQLCVYDLLMGIYILLITAKNFQYYGSYCIHDVKWRSSTACNAAGVIFTFSSHGSLLTALIMGLYRCYTCERMLVYFSPTKSMIGLALVNIVIFLSSVVTLFPIRYFDKVFVTAVSFEGNPMVKKGTKTMIDTLIQEYYGTELDLNSFSWSDRLARLSNMTSSTEIFKPTGKFGFFNQSPLCIQNLFSDDMGDGIKVFKLIYVTTIGVIIVLFSLSYIWIAGIRLRSAVPTADKSQKAAKERNNKKTSKKVAFIILSQLLAWIPIIVATILSYCNRNVSQDFYEIAAILLIPVNSLLNPLFHSPRKSFRKMSKSSRSTQLSNLTTPPLQKTDKKEFKPKHTKQSSETKEVIELGNILVGIDIK